VPADLSMTNRRARDRADIVLGEDWDRPAGTVESELRAARQRRSLFTLNRSPLARKIIMFNLLAIVVLVAGVMYLNPFRDSLVHQRERALAVEAQLIADIFEASLPRSAPANLLTGDGIDPVDVLGRIGLAEGTDVFVYAAPDTLVASTLDGTRGPARPVRGLTPQSEERLLITDFLNSVWSGLSRLVGSDQSIPEGGTPEVLARSVVSAASEGATVLRRSTGVSGASFAAATPIEGPNGQLGVLVVTTAAGEIDQLVRGEREELLQMFVVALFVSIGLSFVLASTIANPLSDLAAAAELGRDKNARKMSPTRVRIPDLTGRPDEIGRLSGALRGMVSALYDRIDANEQFAADVSHEIKNPLASLRSAVGTMRVAAPTISATAFWRSSNTTFSGSTGWSRTSQTPRVSTVNW
jgi:two-component system sensor histidine kinase ChvG